MFATGLKTDRKWIQTALSAILFVITIAWAQAQNAKPHAAAGTTPHVTVDVDQLFTQKMGVNAGLDQKTPKLSSDGFSYDDKQKLASAECLIDETIVAQKIPSLDVTTLCTSFKRPEGKGTIASADSALTGNDFKQSIDAALIHIVKWEKGKPDGSWYQYTRHAGKWSGKLISQPHDAVEQADYLLGKGNVAFLALHLGIDNTCKIAYDVEAKHTRPLNQQDFIDLVQLAEAYYKKGTGGTTGGAGGTPASAAAQVAQGEPLWGVWGGITLLPLPNLPASITLTPSVGNVKSLKAVATNQGGAGTSNITTSCAGPGTAPPTPSTAVSQHPAGIVGETDFPMLRNAAIVRRAPSDGLEFEDAGAAVTPVSASKKKPSSQSQAQGAPAQTKDSSSPNDPLSSLGVTVPNETLYWWDVSVAMPVTSFNQLTYNSTDNLVELKKTNDIKPYALFDFFPFKADLKAKNYLSMPKLSAGLPLASQPLQKTFVGTGFTIGIGSFRFQPLVGLRIEKDQRTTTLTPGSSANQAQLTNDLRYQWHAKLQVMIGFSVADAKKVLGLK
jgi:hypothetical protein